MSVYACMCAQCTLQRSRCLDPSHHLRDAGDYVYRKSEPGWTPPFGTRTAVTAVFLGVSKKLDSTHSQNCDLNANYRLTQNTCSRMFVVGEGCGIFRRESMGGGSGSP